MTLAYVYQAALICDDCAAKLVEGPGFAGRTPIADDSDKWPQGPYENGGGESDCPQHCDHCQEFLENPLTSDGESYVRQEVAQTRAANNGLDSAVTAEWVLFYGYLNLGPVIAEAAA